MSTFALIGAPGAGKSTVGALLARRLNLGFYDMDAEIERVAGKPVAEIFADDGEAFFRELEEKITCEFLLRPGVISLGGGAIMNEQIRSALAMAKVIWLEVSISQATRRVGLNQARPLLVGNIRAKLIEMLRKRTPFYRDAATWTIPTDGRTIEEIVLAIEEEIHRES